MNRGLAVPISYKLLAPVEEHTEENIKMANILGWCIELVSRKYNAGVLLLSPFMKMYLSLLNVRLIKVFLILDANILLGRR